MSANYLSQHFGVHRPADWEAGGGIIGITEIVDCVNNSKSKWANPGHYHFVLLNSRPLPFVRWKGVQSLQTPSRALLAQLGLV